MKGLRWKAGRARARLTRELPRLRRPASAAVPDLEPDLRAFEEKLVWIFGSPRSGSSWLLRLLGAQRDVVTIDETYIPEHLVPIGMRPAAGEHLETGPRADDPNYFFARPYLLALRPELRRFILRQMARQAHRLGHGRRTRWVVIKEPHGSHAAETMVSLLPGARVLFLLRDGRDVVDSLADAMLGEETWWRTSSGEGAGAGAKAANRDRLAFIRANAELWVRRTAAVQRALASLPDERRLLVRYEDLRRDTPCTLRSIYAWLSLEASDRVLRARVSREAFEAIPSDRRGPSREYRFATPGRWRESFGAEERQVLDEVMGGKLRELGYER